MIAEDLGIDGVELRLKNALHTGDVTVNKLQIISCGLSETIQKVAERAEWKKKKSEGLPDRGIGIACGGFVCGVRTAALSDSGAIIKLNEDGGIVLLTGAADIGQGSDTVLAQIAAEVLGVTLDDITVVAGDTDATPYDAGSIGSRVTTYAGGAVIKAAQDLKNQLAEVAAGMLQCNPEDLEFRDRNVWVRGAPERNLSFPRLAKATQVSGSRGVVMGKGSFSPINVEWPNHNGEGNVAQSYSFATQAAEVEVDQETGKIKFLKMTVGDDIGFPLNPVMVEGQVEGSVSMGQGLVMYEQLITREGMILNPSYTNYKMPSALDSPQIETIHTITNDPLGPFGGKEVGEGIIVSTPAAIANAIHDAIGVWIKDLPLTPDKIVKALQEKEGRQ
jgi:4-hydroxybenzoyl-CoA reductase subunit alpha